MNNADLSRLLAARNAEIRELNKERKELLAAVEFYADPQRYQGMNREPIPNDPHQPEWLPYMLDVLRDGGHIARRTILKVTK